MRTSTKVFQMYMYENLLGQKRDIWGKHRQWSNLDELPRIIWTIHCRFCDRDVVSPLQTVSFHMYTGTTAEACTMLHESDLVFVVLSLQNVNEL